MSGNKKSPTLLILFILFLVGAGYLLWSLYGNNNSSEMPPIDQSVTQIEPDDELSQDTTIVPTANIGEAGTVKILPVNETLGVRGIGNPNAPVQIREYFSLTCNHCAAFHKGTFKQLKTKYIDTGKVYFIYEEMPLNGPALYGSMIARCLPAERYPEFVALLLDTQDKWAFGGDFKIALQQNAALAGMSEDDFNACFSNEDMRKAIAENIDASAQAWKISSTPSFIFNNGERILRGGQDIEAFDAIYNLLNNKKTTNEQVAPIMEQTNASSSTTPSITTPVNETKEFEPNGEVIMPVQNIE